MLSLNGVARRRLFHGLQLGLVVALVATMGAPRAVAGSSSPPDLEGMPDLTVRQDVLAHQWVVRDEYLPPNLCSVVEAGIPPGVHKLIRFTVMTPNIGDADLVLGDPNAHMEANDGFFEYATCHRHYHLRNHSLYQLVDPNTGKVWRAAKAPFCMLDSDPNPAYLGEPPRSPQFKSCGAIGIPGNQGISHGWADTYRFFLGGQYVILDGSDGQEPIPAGDYLLRITVNPAVTPGPGDPCPVTNLVDAGMCHMVAESNYDNNVAQARITIPERPGKRGVGPLADVPMPAGEPSQ